MKSMRSCNDDRGERNLIFVIVEIENAVALPPTGNVMLVSVRRQGVRKIA